MIYIPDDIFFDFLEMDTKHSDSEDFEKFPEGKDCRVYECMEEYRRIDKEFWKKESKKSVKELREEYGDVEVWLDFCNVIINLKNCPFGCTLKGTYRNCIERKEIKHCHTQTFTKIVEHFYKDVDPKYIEILLKYMETYEEI